MPSLELKIFPPLVALLVAVAMGVLTLVLPPGEAPFFRGPAAIVIAAAGFALSLSGALAFRRSKTTANPREPQTASFLVVSGVYKITRNPMYLGLLCLLLAWAAFLWSPWALAGPVAFVAYISRFQIAPEERALAALFGGEYLAYRARVRRWL